MIHTVIHGVLTLNTVFFLLRSNFLVANLVVADNIVFADVFDLSVEHMLYQTGAGKIYKFEVQNVFGNLF